MRGWLAWVVVAALLAGCRAGSAPAELEQLRARVSTLEAENAHLSGQVGLLESEREQLRQQVSSLGVELAKAQGVAGGADPSVLTSQYLVVMPREARAGEWVAVYVRNYPIRLLNQAGIALRAEAGGDTNLVHLPRLAAANVFLLSIPPQTAPGAYRVVLGEAGPLGPGAKVDDQVTIRVAAGK